MTESDETRTYAAALARRYYEGTVTKDVFIDAFAEMEDPLIQEIVYLVHHEPKRKGFVEDTARHYAVYRDYVEAVLAELDKGEAGVVPEDKRPQPKAGNLRIVGWSAFALFAAASAAERARDFIWHFSGIKVLALWEGIFSSIGLVIGSFAALVTVRHVIFLVRYRLEKRRNRTPAN